MLSHKNIVFALGSLSGLDRGCVKMHKKNLQR